MAQPNPQLQALLDEINPKTKAKGYDPLDALQTSQKLRDLRQAQSQQAYLNMLANGSSAAERGGMAAGYALAGGLQKLWDKVRGTPPPSDPEAAAAQQNDEILRIANEAGNNVSDPFDRRIAIVQKAGEEARSRGLFDLSSQLDDQLVSLKQQQLELRKLGANTTEAEVTAKNAPEKQAADIAETQSQTTERERKAVLTSPEMYVNPSSGQQAVLDSNLDSDMEYAKMMGMVPVRLSVQAAGLDTINRTPLPPDVQDKLNYNLGALQTYHDMRDLAHQVPGLMDANGVPRPDAVIQWAGGKLGLNQAANSWQRLQAKARADVQSIIRGNPSNRDAMVFEALVPEFFDPENVKTAKIDLLQDATGDLVRNAIAYYRGTKQPVPPDVINRAKELNVDVGNIAPKDQGTAERDARAIAVSVQQRLDKINFKAEKTDSTGRAQEILDRANEARKRIRQ